MKGGVESLRERDVPSIPCDRDVVVGPVPLVRFEALTRQDRVDFSR
jgi:hypothetical protein